MKSTVCVTGGSGGVGQTLLKYLSDRFHVKALFRKASAASRKWQEQGCEIIFGDLSDETSLTNLVAGSEFVFHCAALTTCFSEQEAQEVNVEGTRRLALAAVKAGCKRFIHISSNAVYRGVDRPENIFKETVEIKEASITELYCLTKFRAELALQQVAQDHSLEYVIFRPTYIYGPGVPSYTIAPFEAIQKGQPVIFGDGQGLLDPVYVDDVVRAMLLAAYSPEANGQIFNIEGSETISFQEFYAYYGRMLNRPVRNIPKKIVNSIARLTENYWGFGKTLKWLLELHGSTDEYPSTKATERLGYTPQVSLTVGMLKTELWLQKNGYLTRGNHILKNADSLYHFSPCAVVHPTTESEIIQIIQEAAQHNLKVRAIGALHSLAPIPETEGVCIVLDQYKQVVRIQDSLVTVQAGMRICELNEILAQHHLALPILGTIDQQTVSGAISTGTHGGSFYHQSLSSSVQALRLVRADGSILDVDCSDDRFQAVVLSMGLFGVVSTVTFNCVPTFSLRSETCQLSIDTLLQKFDDIHKNNRYVDIRYTPITDRAQLSLINPDTDAGQEKRGWHPVKKSKLEQRLTHVVNGLALRLFRAYNLNWLQRWGIEQHEKTAYATPSGRSDFVLTHFDATTNDLDELVPGVSAADMELAIPYSQARAALICLRDHFHATQKYPSIHIHLRCAAAEDFWLSPAYKQPICWMEFWEYPRTGEFFQEIVEVLKPFNFRCHWGKHIPVESDYLKKHYEKWEDFVQLRQAFDPNRMFANPCLDQYFQP
jgi:L-gulonolactone oxidase